jgi:CheY-like chemotaxis protein
VPHKVLIVDDEAELRIATSEFLEQRGFEVTEAASCKNAIYEFRRNKPDAVILDYALPDGSALDILRQLQSIDSTVPTINGARAVLLCVKHDTGRLGQWMRQLELRAPRNKVIVAVANKLARIVWAVLSSGNEYRTVPVAAA